MEKQKSLLDPKISYRFWGHCNLRALNGLCLFCNSNCMKLPFPDVFDETVFLYASLFYQNLCHLIIEQIPTMLKF